MEYNEKKRLVISVPEAGNLLGLCRNASYNAAHKGDIPTIRIGHKMLVPIAMLEEKLKTKISPELWSDVTSKG